MCRIKEKNPLLGIILKKKVNIKNAPKKKLYQWIEINKSKISQANLRSTKHSFIPLWDLRALIMKIFLNFVGYEISKIIKLTLT